MYSHFFDPSIANISLAIYLLGALCLLLGIKLFKAEKENRRNRGYILYLDNRITKLEENTNGL